MIEPSARSRSEVDGVTIHVRQKRRAFRCVECGAQWDATYEVREYVGPTGERWIVHCRDGRPVPAPMFGDRCPMCGRVSVTFSIEMPPGPSMDPPLDAAAG